MRCILVVAFCLAALFAAMSGWAQPALAQAKIAQDDDEAQDAGVDDGEAVDETDASADADTTAESDDAGDAADVPAVPTITEPTFEVSRFDLVMNTSVEGVEPADLLAATASFSPVNDVFTAPQPAAGRTQVALADFNDERVRTFDATGLQVVMATLLAYLNDEVGLIGVVVAPHPEDIAPDLADLRDGRTELRIMIYTAQVGRVRTMGSGDRVPDDERENHPSHDRVRLNSPLQSGAEPGTGDPLWRGRLDDYLFQLNRHPGRRVDAAISSGLTPGTVTLDYLIAESKPWYIYAQLSNTGTESTDELRERFGFTHNQLTGNDDIFAIDYVTANFDETHAVSVSYERPLNDRLRARVFARYSEYTAADVGFAGTSFNGDDIAIGGDLILNIAQFDELFIDLVGGVQYMETRTENDTTMTEGEEDFFLGHVGLEAERLTDISQTNAYVDVLWNFNRGDMMEMTDLGRFDPDERFVVLTFGVTHSFYLEPLLNYDAWADISDPDTSTLAHEVVLGLRGQTSLGNRLIPTFESTAGGLYTVRGYDESAVVGDNALIATAEYRYHVARGLALRDDTDDLPRVFGQPFRTRPETVYGSADWDLVLKAFFDAARVTNSDRATFESNETLLGTGIGFELSIRNNIRFRGDWGIALEDAGRVDAGDNRFHFILTILY
ncbi:hypothetical protein OT109_15505 [Phycisphaeraceae bacterium D3-23]